MDSDHFEQLSRLFAEACELPSEQREAFLAERCAGDAALRRRLEQMLASDANATPFLEAPEDPTPAPEGPGVVGGRIGRFRILGVLAAGGMGVVYEAEQERPQRRVALKVMRKGAMSAPAVRRFRIEAELLGRLDHPGVARIFDAGVHTEISPGGIADEIPYFAMEFVDGRPISDALRGKAVRERLELMARVCDAVHHAHQRGVIHRDLKPSNILVTEAGNPKILDFGVARAIDAEKTTLRTHVGQLIGTLAYMSPEQVSGDSRNIDARSDVYALGAVLYEILTGHCAHDLETAAIPEAIRIVRDVDPPALGAIDRSLRGELEVIVSTAMAKEPDRRYASAAQLGADIRRYLADEPIQARPASAIYQLRKLARRHRPVFLGAVIAIGALLAAAIISSVMAIQLAHQRDVAQRALTDSRRTGALLLDLFLGSPDEPLVDRIEVLRRAERLLRGDPPADLATRAKWHEYIGHGYLKVWSQAKAADHLQQALQLRESIGTLNADLIKSTHLLAMQRLAAGRIEEGETLLRQTLQRRRELWGPEHMTVSPPGELLWFITRYTPDEPEVEADADRRAALRAEAQRAGAPPQPPPDMPLVFEDTFEAPAPDPLWERSLHVATDWEGRQRNSRLTVTAITVDPDRQREAGLVRFAHDLDLPLGDFWLQAHIGWDSLDDVQVTQTLQVGLSTAGRNNIAYIAYTDGWVQHPGGRSALIGADDALPYKAGSGHNTLPLAGEATVTMSRRSGEVTIWWNDKVFLRGASAEPAGRISFSFSTYPYTGLEGTTRFGELWIDSLVLHGAVDATGGPGQ